MELYHRFKEGDRRIQDTSTKMWNSKLIPFEEAKRMWSEVDVGSTSGTIEGTCCRC